MARYMGEGTRNSSCRVCRFFFFFQAEDGIRDLTVTGVQTCALPISLTVSRTMSDSARGVIATMILGGSSSHGRLERSDPVHATRAATAASRSHAACSLIPPRCPLGHLPRQQTADHATHGLLASARSKRKP